MKIRGLMFTCVVLRVFALILSGGTVLSVYAADDVDKEQKNTAYDFLQAVRNLIVHGDLADDTYYSHQLNIQMEGTGRTSIYEWGPVCGKVKTGRFGEYFNNVETPPFIDTSHHFSGKCGDFPYWKEFLPNGNVSVTANIYVDMQKTCISKNDLNNALEGIDYSHGPYNRDFVYLFGGKNNIGLMDFTSGPRGCIAVITLFQNQNGDGRK